MVPFVHRHLDWRTPLDWLGSQPYLLLEERDSLVAILACPPEPQEAAWIRLFAVEPLFDEEEIFRLLVEKAHHLLESSSSVRLVALALQPWFEELLISSGFSTHQSIVVLEWNEILPPVIPSPVNMTLRPMQSNDLSVVQHLDELAFEPIWQYSELALVNALAQTAFSTVAEIDSQIVAYQMSTAYTYTGHLARLAVHPQLRRQSIGYNLVRHLLAEFKARGIWRVTVNTQSDNLASQRLYQKLGFHFTGENIPVYEYH